MLKPEIVDINALADEAIISSPDIDLEKAQKARLAFTSTAGHGGQEGGPTESIKIGTPDESNVRHGRVAAKSVAVGFKGLTGEALEDDISSTMGDVMGEVFAAIGRAGSRGLYYGVLGLFMLPLGAVVTYKVARVLWTVEGEPKKDA